MSATTPRERFLRFAGWLVLGALPILVPLVTLERYLAARQEEQLTALGKRLEQDLSLFRLEMEPREVFLRGFTRLFRRLARAGFTSMAVTTAPEMISRKLGAQTVAFSPDGRGHPLPWSHPVARFVVERLWEDLLARTYHPQRDKMYRTLLGPRFLIWDVWSRAGYPLDIGTGKGEGYMIWRRNGPRSGLLSFFPARPPAFDMVSDALPHLPQPGFWAAFDPAHRRIVQRGLPPREWRQGVQQAILRKMEGFAGPTHLFRLQRHPEGFWMVRALPWKEADHGPWRRALWWMALLLPPLIFRTWYAPSRLPLERLSIVPRTILLFGMTVLMPASLLLGMGLASFRERALTLERQAFDQGVARLRALDQGYQRFLDRLLAFDRRIRDHPVVSGPDGKRVTRLANRFRDREFASRFETRNAQGEFIGRMQTTETTTLYLTTMFAKEVLRRFLGSVIPYEDQASETFSRQVLQSALIGFAGIFDQPDTLLSMDFDRQNSIWYYDIRSPTADRPMAYLLIIHQTYSLHETFLKTALGSETHAFQDRHRRWFPGKPPHPVLAVLAAESLYGRRTARRVIALPDGRPGLAIAYPSSQLGGYVFTTVADLSGLAQGERQLRRLLAASLSLLALLAVTYASFLAEGLIRPVQELAGAVAALERRDFTHRLSVRGEDEFGTLARAFNRLIEDFGDLDFAREVQRNLLPARPPTLPNYAMQVFTRSATDLGGDYCDTLMTADGRVLLITGDVTGHGISSALVATMAKTTAVLAAHEGWSIPRLLESLNRLLFQVFQRKKMMTMVVAYLDPRAHTLEWACVGHPFPVVRQADGRVSALSMIAYPLGARKTAIYKTQMHPLQPGDLVMFYSDGVVEAQTPGGELFGYRRLGKLISGLPAAEATSPDRVADILVTTLEAFTAQGVPTDDVTFLLLARQA